MSIKIEIQNLVKLLNDHSYNYHTLDNPLISDDEYDKLYATLKELEQQHPTLITKDSPTQKVGDDTKLSTIKHNIPMLSLGNVFDVQGVIDLFEKHGNLGLEYKYDGIAISITYENGILVQAVTRGDGEKGENVTNNVKTIRNVPHTISHKDRFEIRGEIVFPLKEFNEYNDSLIASGKKPLVNPRNGAAGTIRQKDSAKCAERKLSFFAYSVVDGLPNNIETQTQVLDWIQTLGFDVLSGYTEVTNKDQIGDVIESITSKRSTLPMDIDGIVAKVNKLSSQKSIGFKGREPYWAVAYKFPSQGSITSLEDITWQVGRTGAITPVANVSPCKVAGVTINNVSLYNVAEIRRLNLHTNDKLYIVRSGDVIPKITKVYEELRSGSPVIIPTNCPSCNHELTMCQNNIFLQCENHANCSAQIVQQISYFVSRDAMDIDGISEQTIKDLFNNNMIKNSFDLYRLAQYKDVMYTWNGYGKRSIDKMLKSIEDSRNIELNKFIYALGIDGIGRSTSRALADNFHTMDNVRSVSHNELIEIDDIGYITATSITSYFSDNKEYLDEYLTEFNIIEKDPNVELPLKNQSWVLTGSYTIMSRNEAADMIIKLGGKVTNSISKNTTGLILGDGGGSKLEKAKKLNVAIHDQTIFNRFKDML